MEQFRLLHDVLDCSTLSLRQGSNRENHPEREILVCFLVEGSSYHLLEDPICLEKGVLALVSLELWMKISKKNIRSHEPKNHTS